MRYRQYCTRKLRRVRKRANYSNRNHGYKKKLLNMDLNNAKSDEFVVMPLINAERAWSYAMQLKSDLNQDSARKRLHLLKRLKKAAVWSKELVRVCNSKADAHTQLEAEAYSSWMHGNMYLEQEKHQEAFQNFAHAKTVYEQLNKVGLAASVLYQERITEIQPNIRYCRYVLSRSGTEVDEATLQSLENDPKVLALLHEHKQKAHTSSSNTVQVIRHLGQVLTIPSSDKLILALQRAQELHNTFSSSPNSDLKAQDTAAKLQSQATEFSQLFSSYEDALAIVRVYQ